MGHKCVVMEGQNITFLGGDRYGGADHCISGGGWVIGMEQQTIIFLGGDRYGGAEHYISVGGRR